MTSPGPNANGGNGGNTIVHPREALRRLVEGNARFVAGVTSARAMKTASPEYRTHLANGQAPFAAIVACSDSRVPSEIVFDQGLGDLFIIRNAGSVLGHAPLASIEFAVAKLGVRLVMVLVHEKCGAIKAAYETVRKGVTPPTESLRELVRRIAPAVQEATARPYESSDAACELAAHIHARRVCEELAASPAIAPHVREGTLLVVPAYYRLAEGTVEFLDPVQTAAAPIREAAVA